MHRKYKITIAILSVALAMALIGIAVLSGTLTKFATTGSAKALARVAKWGIDIEAGSDIDCEYKSEGGTVYVSTTDKDGVIIPGTRGALTYVKTSGSPEVKYDINIDGDTTDDKMAFSVGEGYYASSRLVRGEKGTPIEYFPIIIRFTHYDLSGAGTKTNVVSKSYAIGRDDVDVTCTGLGDLVTKVNAAIGTDLDVNNNPPAPDGMTRVYAIEWDWPYETTGDASYQTNVRDTSLCEAINQNKDNGIFEIRVNTLFEMMQSN